MSLIKFQPSSDALEIPVSAPKEMISVGSEKNKIRVRINSSSLGVIQECMRKASLSLDQEWRHMTESPATVFGSAVHKALEIFYTASPEKRDLPSLKEVELVGYGHKSNSSNLILQAIEAFRVKAEPLALLPDTDKRSIANGVWTLWHYFKDFINDPYVAHLDREGRPYVERGFTLRLYEDNELIIDYFGTIDLIVRHVQTGEIHAADHKTSSVVGTDFYNRLKPNHQYTGYLLGARETLGVDTNSFLVNCIQVKAKPLTARGTPPHFPRQITTRDDSDFAEFKETVYDAVIRYLAAKKGDIWPMGHVNACATYGGCQYLSVCSAPKTMREGILTAKFNRRGNPEKEGSLAHFIESKETDAQT